MEAQRNRWLACSTHPRNAPPRASPCCVQTGVWKRVQAADPTDYIQMGPNGLRWAHSSQVCADNEHVGFLCNEATATSSFPLPASSTSHIAMCRQSLRTEAFHPSFVEGYATLHYLVFTAEWGFEQKHPKEHAGTCHLMLSGSPGKALVICGRGSKSNCG